tara:strand:+ start:10617 stop:10844 length:228 start_codon:yes stop_codon:yes gene_type:complete
MPGIWKSETTTAKAPPFLEQLNSIGARRGSGNVVIPANGKLKSTQDGFLIINKQNTTRGRGLGHDNYPKFQSFLC